MERLIDKLADKHKDWIRMAKSFGCSDDDANELVQQMYVRLTKYVDDPKRIMYDKESLNTYYVYITLRNLYLTNFHKNKIYYPLKNHSNQRPSVLEQAGQIRSLRTYPQIPG